MIRAMGLEREQLFVTNVVLCRPPGNRIPTADEIKACSRFLSEQLIAVCPRVIVALGTTASQALTKRNRGVTELRKEWYKWEEIPLKCTWHPAYLLRSPGKKVESWKDLQAVMTMLKSIKEKGLQEESVQ